MFKEESLCEVLSIPLHKPDLHHVLDLMIVPELLDSKLISTPKGLSYEGQYLTGLKLLIYLSLKEKVTYISNTPKQSIHAVHYSTFKTICIALPSSIQNQNTLTLYDNGSLCIIPSIESIYTKTISSRHIHKYILLRVTIS